MTDEAPKELNVRWGKSGDVRVSTPDGRYISPDVTGHYTLTTRADHALVAEAYEVAAREAEEHNEDIWEYSTGNRAPIVGMKDPIATVIRALTPADAIAAREADHKQVREQALDAVLKEVEGYLPEFGAGEPQDGTDRIIDQCWRDFRKVVTTLIEKGQDQ